jgi:hypothetical protein
MTKSKSTTRVSPVDNSIHTIRNQRVILASALAAIYGVETRTLNQAVKRNADKFPPDFMFQLNPVEVRELPSRSQNVILKRGQNIKYLPYAFTEHGVVMAANVLNSKHAVTMSVFVVRAFIRLRELAVLNNEFAQKLSDLERKLTARQDLHEKAILKIISQLRALLTPSTPKTSGKRIGFRNEQP